MPLRHSLPSLGLLLLICPALAAQRVDLLLREEGSLLPISGAIVRLVGETGVVAQALSGETGRVSLRAPAPGTYRIKADRIGWAGILSAPIDLAEGQVQRTELLMPTTRLELPTIEVRGASRCGGRQGPEALAIWEEIQKALTASVITAGERQIPLHVREFRRWAQRNGETIREYNVRSSIVRGQVYASLPPATLASTGFVVMDARDSVTYAVPDAALLISNEFSATHCFGVEPGDEGLVGLTFEPVPGHRLPDVRGTLWVDRASGELSFLEYRYTGLEGLLSRADLGGRVEYQRLPSGAWIVRYWQVRTPDITVSQVRGTGGVRRELPRLVGYLDLGARVSIAGDPDGVLHLAVLRGRVAEAGSTEGLAGAIIRVEGVADTAITDAQGNYEMALPVFGLHQIAASHPRMGVLPSPPVPPQALSLGDTTEVNFEAPPLSRLVRQACGNTGNLSGVVGVVLDVAGRPAEGIELKSFWRTTNGSKEVRTRTGRGGFFGFCDLPADDVVPIQVFEGARPVGETKVEIGFRSYRWVELRMAPPPD